MIEIGGLWKKMGKNGEYFTGTLGSATLLVFPNTKKTAANQPDFRVMIAEKKPQAQGGAPYKKPQNHAPQAARPPGPPVPRPMQAYAPPHAPGSDEPPVWDDQDPNYPQF